MNEPLVDVSGCVEREACLGVAARLARLGFPALVAQRSDAMPLGGPRFVVTVPRSLAPHAARLVRGWSGSVALGAYRTPVAPEQERPRRPRRLGAFFALGLGFGLGHLYGRELVSATILCAAQLACLALAARGLPAMLIAFAALVLLDAWGALRAVDRDNDGRPRAPATQLASTFPAAALVVAIAAVLSPRGYEPRASARASESSWIEPASSSSRPPT